MSSRFMHALVCALLGTASLSARANAQGGDTPARGISLQEIEFWHSLTPDGWAKNAEGLQKCSVAPAPGDAAEQKWKTDSLVGVLSLPKEFHEVPLAAGSEGNRWVGADSSSIEIHGTHALYRGGMGMGGMDIGRPIGAPTSCAITLEGRPAPSHTLMLTRPAHGDTLYVDTPNTVIRNGVGLQIIILSNSPAREAQLIAAAQTLKVSQKTP